MGVYWLLFYCIVYTRPYTLDYSWPNYEFGGGLGLIAVGQTIGRQLLEAYGQLNGVIGKGLFLGLFKICIENKVLKFNFS